MGNGHGVVARNNLDGHILLAKVGKGLGSLLANRIGDEDEGIGSDGTC